MKPKVQTLGAAIARARRDGGQVKLSTFIPLKIRKRGASQVVVRPDGQVETTGKVVTQIDQLLLVARCRPTGWRSGRWWRGLIPDRATRPQSPVPRHRGIRRSCPPAASRRP